MEGDQMAFTNFASDGHGDVYLEIAPKKETAVLVTQLSKRIAAASTAGVADWVARETERLGLDRDRVQFLSFIVTERLGLDQDRVQFLSYIVTYEQGESTRLCVEKFDFEKPQNSPQQSSVQRSTTAQNLPLWAKGLMQRQGDSIEALANEVRKLNTNDDTKEVMVPPLCKKRRTAYLLAKHTPTIFLNWIPGSLNPAQEFYNNPGAAIASWRWFRELVWGPKPVWLMNLPMARKNGENLTHR